MNRPSTLTGSQRLQAALDRGITQEALEGDREPDSSTTDASQSATQEAVKQWRAVRSRALQTASPAALERQLSRGKLLTRERIERLLDPGSFHELHMLRETADVPLLNGKRALGDGIVAGWGTVEGRRTFVFSQDPLVIGGSLGQVGGAKVHKVLDLAIDAGAPIVGISDGGGARIQEGVASLYAFGGIFFRNTRASGIVPQISLIMGAATGGAVYSPALTDFVFMVEGTATMAITGPRVVKEVTGEDVTLESLGGARVHAEQSGVVHFVAPDEPACLERARRLLGFLPQSNREQPPVTAPWPPPGDKSEPLAALPVELDAPYDVRRIIVSLIDAGDLLEYAARWAPNIVCGFARLDGHPVGIVANQPGVMGGELDIDACEKAARFLRTCDAFNLPVVTIVDCPGFVPGAGQEHGGLIRSAAKLVHAYVEATSPQVHLIAGRAYGTAVTAMGATASMPGLCLAWPTADVAGSRPSGTQPRVGPYDAATAGTVDEVIEPHETRTFLLEALTVLRTVDRPPVPRKHENLPL